MSERFMGILLAAAAVSALTATPSPQDEIDEILRTGGPRFYGSDPQPSSPVKRLMLGELNPSDIPAPKRRKFRHNRKG